MTFRRDMSLPKLANREEAPAAESALTCKEKVPLASLYRVSKVHDLTTLLVTRACFAYQADTSHYFSIFRPPTLLSQPLGRPPETLLSQLAFGSSGGEECARLGSAPSGGEECPPLIWRQGVRASRSFACKEIDLS
jgi:hypothetical protein